MSVGDRTIDTILGTPVFVNDACMGDGDERLFPESRHRSKRILKKLIKRFGGEFVQVPCAYYANGAYYMHPECYEGFKNQTELEIF